MSPLALARSRIGRAAPQSKEHPCTVPVRSPSGDRLMHRCTSSPRVRVIIGIFLRVRIDITVFDGLDELDALGPLEVFRSAQSLGADIEARLVSSSKAEEVRGAFGLRLRPDAVYVPGEADVLVVVGGGWGSRSDVGAWGEVQRGDWPSLIADAKPVSYTHLR